MTYLLGKHPFIKLTVKLDQKRWVDLDCLVDTGFSGRLAIPEHYKTSFPASEFIEAQFVLDFQSHPDVYHQSVFSH